MSNSWTFDVLVVQSQRRNVQKSVMHVQCRCFDDPVTVAVVVACATDETKPLVKSVCETAPKSLFWVPPVNQDLSTRHDWSVKKAIVDLPIRVKENSKRASGNLLSPLGAQNK